MQYKLGELLDVPKLQALFDSFDKLHQLPSAVIDIEGNILTATAWQDICTKFHRANPQTEKECIKSDTHLVGELSKGISQVVYKCPHGLVDTATPIVVDGKHLGNAFTGQFFLEPPDEEHFREMAKQYGFDEETYIKAMRRVPVITEDRHKKNLEVLARLTEILAEMGLKQKRQLETEQALRESRETFKTLVEFTNAIHWELDLATNKFTYVSPQIEEMLGYPPERWASFELWAETVHPEDREYAVNYCSTETGKGKDHAFVFRAIAADGTIVWLHDIVNVISQGGKPVKLIGVMLDITSLKQSESHRRSIIATSIDGFWIVDLKGRLLEVNDSYCQMIGYSRDELLNMDIMDVEAVESPEDTKRRIGKIMELGSVKFESRHKKKDGSIIDVGISTMYSPDEKVLYVFVRDITARKQVENDLFKSEAFIKTVLDNLPIGIAVNSVDPTVDFEYMNDKFPVFYRTTREELAGPDAFWTAVFEDPEYREYIKKRVVDDCATGDPEKMHWEDVVITRKGKETRFITAQNTPIQDNKLMISTVLDMTERKQTEEMLLRTQFSMDKTRDAVYWMGPDARFTYVNDSATQALGYTRQELLTMDVHEIGPEFSEDVWPSHWEELRKRGSFVFESVHKRKDGSVFPVEISVNYMKFGDKEYNCAFARDITERREAEEALKESEELFRTAFDTSPDFISITKMDGTYVDVNEGFEKIGGFPKEAIIGRTSLDLNIWCDPDDRKRLVDEISSKGYAENVEAQFKYADGTIITGLMSASVITLNNEPHILSITRDITERKATEIKIAYSLKEKEVLLKEVHHRVKNNMAVISSLLSLQSGYIEDEKSLALFRESQGRIRSMALVHEKLYQSSDFAHIDVQDYVNSLAQDVMSAFMGRKDVSTDIIVEAIEMDIDNLIPCGLIINELLTNAFKHAFDGVDNPEISISMVKVDDDNVLLTIRDNGKGLPEGFDVSSSKGLGLKIVCALSEQLDAKLEVAGDDGTIIKLTFPEKLELTKDNTGNG